MQNEIKTIKNKLSKYEQLELPSGAVMAFNLARCPSGWADFEELRGRTIVGSGHGEGLTQRGLHETGGEETHTLTIDEMPKHSHYVSSATADTATPGSQLPFKKHSKTQWPTSSVGNNIGHNNMQPYMALLYCQKE
jgi:microcystin-dependent protein